MTPPHSWRDARVLVTGARGFIAQHLCRRLIHAGAQVTGVSTRAGVHSISGMEWLHADLTSFPVVQSVFDRARPDFIFHLAGHVTGSQDLANVEPTFASNLASTVHLLTGAATQSGRCRVVLAGSMQEPDPADASAIPCSPYAVSKWACSGYARTFHALYGLPVVTARPMMVYGPGQWDTAKLLPYVTTSLLAGTSPAVSSGARELDWVYVDDVVDGFLKVALASDLNAVTIDLGSGTLTSIRDIVARLGALIDPKIPIRFGALSDRPLERPRAALVAETQALIEWVAETSLDEGLARTVAWYRTEWCSPKPA
jgi:UDP-glucose 4-epimerase